MDNEKGPERGGGERTEEVQGRWETPEGSTLLVTTGVSLVPSRMSSSSSKRRSTKVPSSVENKTVGTSVTSLM